MKSTVDPQEIIGKPRVVAVVGASKNPEKDAYTVPEYLLAHGFTVIPINPTADAIHGVRVYPSLKDIPEEVARTVEVVDVFRPSEEFPEVARQVVAMKARAGKPLVFWGQLGLENEEAKGILSVAGIDYVMDSCMRTEHQRKGAR
ncbi:MAG: CoA-binding protein [archaeon]|nr:MAG: CoA-binding protein [archaeon]